MRFYLVIGVILLTVSQALSADPGKISIDVAHPGIKISPMLYGLMTEEINHSYDGGLYAELIQNRIFQDNASNPVHWSVVKAEGVDAKIALDQTDPVNTIALKRSLRLDITTPGQRAGIANDGYWGIPLWPNTQYKASFYAKASPGLSGPLTVDIESNNDGKVLAQATVPAITSNWKKYEVAFSTAGVRASATNRFVISTTAPGSIWFSLVSLFPTTFNDRPNGSRIDLMQKMVDLHTTFLRLPGGNYLEGDTIDSRFEWKNTLGPLEDRAGHQGPWRYRSSDGLGLLEFFNWCEDLRVQPVLAVYAGYSLRGAHVNPGPDLEPFVQDALDEIEYATGDATTKWGARRAKEGHPEPFVIKYIEIGNEDGFDRSGSYDGRFAQFADAIKAKYPQLQTIATAAVRSRRPDVIDDHFYRSARAMERDNHHYDNTPRNGPKIFVGEWATQEGIPTPDMNAAVGDAAWLTGLERNSDVVIMTCYAPLLVNVNRGGRQWPTNLIGFDAVSSFGSPSYYAQKMFYENRGDTVLPVQIAQQPLDLSNTPTSHGGIGLGTWQTMAEFKDIKVSSAGQTLYQSDFSNDQNGWRTRGGTWSVQDGNLRQMGNPENVRATLGDAAWGDYTYTLKARKIAGSEGFLISFHVEDRNNFYCWNLGGWGNSHSALQHIADGNTEEFGDSQPVTIETGKWYDIRIELTGRDMKFYLDDKLIASASEPASIAEPVLATASRDDASGDLILKVVNTLSTPQSMQIKFDGATEIPRNAHITMLTGNPKDVNTIDDPKKIFPQQSDITIDEKGLLHEFPAESVTVMRLPTK